jgi:hypothetical protein
MVIHAVPMMLPLLEIEGALPWVPQGQLLVPFEQPVAHLVIDPVILGVALHVPGCFLQFLILAPFLYFYRPTHQTLGQLLCGRIGLFGTCVDFGDGFADFVNELLEGHLLVEAVGEGDFHHHFFPFIKV